MPLYPLKFDLGPLQITGFGLMMMAAFLMGGWVMERDLQSRKLAPDYAWSVIVAAAIGGIIGAKIWYVALHQNLDALLSRGGLVWYGGFVGGLLAVIGTGWRHRIPTAFTADLVAPALAIGYAVGRVGCFLIQDDYGGPTDLPWGVKFPEGWPPTTAQNLSAVGVPIPDGVSPFDVLAVHPTQLYETAAMLLAFALIWRWRRLPRGTGWLFGVYLACAGVERFLVEFVRAKDDRILGSFTVAQAMSVLVVAAGVTLLVKRRTPDAEAPALDAAILRQPPE
jgi:phosphatidylglycerol:prolipoprotein diacylglycerol transferase